MESPYGMTMIGDRLYVGEGANGLKIFDATLPRSLVFESWDRHIEAYDIIAHPIRTDLVQVAGPVGFSQYQIENNDFVLLSQINF